MSTLLRGTAHCYGGIVDGTAISPLSDRRVLRDGERNGLTYDDQLRELARNCLKTVDVDFVRKVAPGDIVIGDRGFGWGHDYEQAVMALKGAGVGAVVCESTRTNFKRNCLHHGLPLVELPGVLGEVKTGDDVEIDLAGGTLVNIRSGAVLRFSPYPSFLLDIVSAGGLYEHLRRRFQPDPGR